MSWRDISKEIKSEIRKSLIERDKLEYDNDRGLEDAFDEIFLDPHEVFEIYCSSELGLKRETIEQLWNLGYRIRL